VEEERAVSPHCSQPDLGAVMSCGCVDEGGLWVTRGYKDVIQPETLADGKKVGCGCVDEGALCRKVSCGCVEESELWMCRMCCCRTAANLIE
jgi:hypothetical protein